MTSINILICLLAQDAPVEIPRTDLPTEAYCVICESNGTGHGLEKPVAGVKYKDKAYYFCNSSEVKKFREDPEAYLPPVLPRPMPTFALEAIGGEQLSVDKGVLLFDFWASWCKPCHEIKPRIDMVRKLYHDKGFEVLSVSVDEKREDLDKYLKRNPFKNPVFWDNGETWAAWKVRAIPALFLVKDGQIIAQWTGKPKKGELETAVKDAVGDRLVTR
ncbi:MAG: redoxin domain-containing protein [Fimbriimonadaceae bacterium]|nr:redoxin domain-containing protein [Fimbriimonadaceae bacterium]QYK55698.1 MAG: redoxin domain-containing protein [Fimbriimonadaceae bacterium]